MKVGALCVKKGGAHFDTPPLSVKTSGCFRQEHPDVLMYSSLNYIHIKDTIYMYKSILLVIGILYKQTSTFSVFSMYLLINIIELRNTNITMKYQRNYNKVNLI